MPDLTERVDFRFYPALKRSQIFAWTTTVWAVHNQDTVDWRHAAEMVEWVRCA